MAANVRARGKQAHGPRCAHPRPPRSPVTVNMSSPRRPQRDVSPPCPSRSTPRLGPATRRELRVPAWPRPRAVGPTRTGQCARVHSAWAVSVGACRHVSAVPRYARSPVESDTWTDFDRLDRNGTRFRVQPAAQRPGRPCLRSRCGVCSPAAALPLARGEEFSRAAPPHPSWRPGTGGPGSGGPGSGGPGTGVGCWCPARRAAASPARA